MRRICAAIAIATLVVGAAPRAEAQDRYVGQLMLVGFGFCPVGWVEANGALLPISEYDVLFTLVGTTYGGDGETTFATPDLRGRVPIGEGAGPGLTGRVLGERGGQESVTLTVPQMPVHTHTHAASTLEANTPNPAAALPARKLRTPLYRGGSPPNTSFDQAAITPAGGSQPHENMPPFTTLRWCISTSGIYPQHP
jgi:microcystin-dependent protein